jgi:putative transposase
MPRRDRLFLPNVPLHIIQRGNNRQKCFVSEADYQKYLSYLSEHADAAACRVHAYVLMGNHVHLLISADDCAAAGSMMKFLGQRYAQYFNWRYHRSGTLWGGRYKSCLVQEETYLLVCQRYIELNPVRAGMVDFPAQYRWSSYRCNAEGKAAPLIRPHPIYCSLGADAAERQGAYRDLFQDALQQQAVDELRAATNNNFALGDQMFLRNAAAAEQKPKA